MRLFGRDLFAKAVPPTSTTAVYSPGSTWLGVVRESFTGAWQRNITCETMTNVLAFSAVYTCVSLISDDISKLRIKLMRQVKPELWEEVTKNSPYLAVLKKPNRYQTRIQFLSQWMTSKLLHGNTYIYLEREKGVVVGEYILDPRLVTPKVANDGSVWYELRKDYLSRGEEESTTVPAEDIIHDRMMTLWHPLVGVSPIYAAGASATQGIRIQANSARFFENMSRPSVHLSAPGRLTDESLARLKKQIEDGFSAGNLGRALVTGEGMKLDVMTIPPADAQMIEQQKWTVEDVGRSFKMPLHKLGMGQPAVGNVASLNQDYYSQCLQTHIEAIELLEDEALGLPPQGLGVELDLDGLLRMDPSARAERASKLVTAGVWAPDEARLVENLPPVAGGGTPYLQMQNFALSDLAKRSAKADPFAQASGSASNATPPDSVPALPAPPAKTAEEAAKELADAVIEKFRKVTHVA